MSRSLPNTPPLSTLSLSQLQAMANDMDALTDRAPRDWFERACYETDRAVIAERNRKKEDMFLAYTRAAQCYVNCRMHPSYAAEKKKDPQWGNRVKEFKETYEAFLAKAKEVKDALKAREVEKGSNSNGTPETPTSQRQRQRSGSSTPSGPDTMSGGSIADRMKALSGKGLDVGNTSKRFSKDFSTTSHTVSTKAKDTPAAPVAHEEPPSSSIHMTEEPTHPAHKKPTVPPKPEGITIHHHSATPPTHQITHEDRESPVRPIKTGSSTRSRASTSASEKMAKSSPPALSPHTSGNQTSAASPQLKTPHLPAPSPAPQPTSNATPSAGPSTRHPLPTIPHSPPTDAVQVVPPDEGMPSGIRDFEQAFPSLSEFGKQFESEEIDLQRPKISYPFERDPDASSGLPTETAPDIHFPDVPSFPDLPSDEATGPSPPSPELGFELRRPASTANVASLPHSRELLSDSPVQADPRPQVPEPSSRPLIPNGHHPVHANSLSFPVAKPTPSQPTTSRSSAPAAQEPLPKPKFPFSNSIEPDLLRSYFLNPATDMLLIDVRSEEDFQKGYVGAEYEPKGAKVNVVRIDPLILLRDGVNSTKIEDALSLAPEVQRVAFEKRHRVDLVVVYDSHSMNWPRRGSPPAPLSRLWDAIYELEFSKKLQRNPVLLTGGYEAWLKFIDSRVKKHQAYAAANGYSYPGHRREAAESAKAPSLPNGNHGLPLSPREPNQLPLSPSRSADSIAKRANRDVPVYQSAQYAKNITDSFGYGHTPQSMTGENQTSHQSSHRPYVTSAQLPRPSHSASPSLSSSAYASGSTPITVPPPATQHPGIGSRRRSNLIEQHGQPYSGYATSPPLSSRQSIDYPQAHALSSIQPPPAAQAHALERYDARPSVVRSGSIRGLDLVAREGDEVRYWNDVVLGLTGLKNLGNTCYMNSTLQCLSATFPFTSFFLDGSYKKSINLYNPLGTKGNLANAFAELLKALWKEDYTFLSPVTFRKSITTFAHQFSGTDQHDSQEFLSFVLDGLHEDLNRIKHKPPPVEMSPEREHALETLPPEVASEKEWQIYRMRNDSFIVDLFQGQYRNRLECLTCHKTSTTYDAFMYMSLPVPTNKSKMVLQELIDEFVKPEIMEGDDAWNCPRCKVPRRASKTLTIARLPPVLLIQLKRFTTQNGVFWDKSETPVIFPVNSLDLTRYVPPRIQSGKEDMDDPRTQIGPFRYDLYGVSNHMGTLSSGHYTAFVKSSKGWQYAEDSKITKAQERDVVSKPAYILFYKRIRT
ncbi:hypothetical protein BCR39DRAFT_512474 [Naematelia encephala]|uniref:ubiquitinyl hydrolase 1 n=1 Tax=Naematelia encephala TaxID=71784 RepID=A0A1Y2BM64_9TREE|nr:hypothetical protein BCR39DRAFT_512474 [Naematelia encephala]